MSLFGSLYSSVSGIQSQGTAIGIISDNISNASTVGYKAGSQYFGTLVTNSGSTVAYSPGGVRAQNRQLINQQGLLQTTSSPLDIAISGNGFFVTQDSLNEGDNPVISYTRAGSFRTDALGNFYNGAGLYLKAWPLDENGDIPSNSASLDSLEVVNIGAASGDASATTRVDVGVRLNASSSVYLGSGDSGKPGADGIDIINRGVEGGDIIVPNANLTAGDTLDIQVNAGATYNFEYGGFVTSDAIETTIFGASTPEGQFQPGAGVLVEDDAFTITRLGDPSNPITFSFVSSSPVAADGEFNSMLTLAQAIDAVPGLTARVAEIGGLNQLYISADDAREGLEFDMVAGSTGDFVTELNLVDTASVTNNRWNTLEGLAALVENETAGALTAEVTDSDNTNATISINNTNPLYTLQFSNGAVTSDFLTEFGISGTIIAPSYDGSASSTTSMASGNITPTFERSIEIYDSLGEAHNVTIAFLKVANNSWRAEIYAPDDHLVTASNQIAAGSITFNNDGSLASIDSALTTGISSLSWSNGAVSSNIDFDFGVAGPSGTGTTAGLSQFSGSSNVKFLTQNGSAAGLLDTVSIDKNGFIIANFNNGQSQRLYKIPLADFANPNGLSNRNGNAFTKTFASGEVNLKEPGTGSVGAIAPSSLESANTEIAEELTDMIVAQRAYQASAKVITTADRLLEELTRLTS